MVRKMGENRDKETKRDEKKCNLCSDGSRGAWQ